MKDLFILSAIQKSEDSTYSEVSSESESRSVVSNWVVSMKHSRPEYWSRLLLPSPVGIFPTQGLNPGLPHCGGIFTSWAIREAQTVKVKLN